MVACVLLTGCVASQAPVSDRSSSSSTEVPVSSRSSPASTQSHHLVRSGDTLFSIAWSAGMDYRTLAEWNNIPSPYIIKPGQRLTLVAASRPYRKNTASPKTTTVRSTPRPESVTTPATSKGWVWPVEGPLLRRFSAVKGSKGIDIGGSNGTSIRAAAGGRVVYAGSGLRGYGRLIIVKHDEVYLSAYAHNSKLLVEDGATVIRGQQIALMGRTGTDRVKLHFEIRQRGKPVDPLKYLSKRP